MQRPPTWSALAMSATLVEKVLRQDCSFRVFSVHTHACNLLTDQGDLVALVSPQHGNGPFHIVVPLALLAQRQTGEVGVYQSDKLVFEKQQLELGSAILWQPQLIPIRIEDITFSFSWLCEIYNLYPASPLFSTAKDAPNPLRSRAAYALHALRQGIQQTDLASATQGIRALIGLGPGLTPAGDDFLVGFLAGLMLNSSATIVPTLFLSELCACIDKAADQTTRLSGAWLRCAAHGQFGEAWHNLASAVDGGGRQKIEQAAHQILSTGATSGVDAMTGLLKAWKMTSAR